MLIYILLLTLLTSSLQAAFVPAPVVLQPVKPAAVKKILKKIKNDKALLAACECEFLEGCIPYYADINNDGEKEYVFLEHQGSGGYLVIHVFTQCGKKISYLQDLIEHNEWHLVHEFINPLTRSSEFLVCAQGKTYICLNDSGSYQEGVRSVYLWENNSISFCCDSYWLDQQRTFFNELCTKERYSSAYAFLYGFQHKASGHIDPKTELLLLKDCAYAAYKNRWYCTGVTLLDKIQQHEAFATTTAAFQQEVAQTRTDSSKAIEDEKKDVRRTTYDYSWLLDVPNDSSIMFDPRIDAFLSATLPDTETLHSLARDRHFQHEVKQHLYLSNLTIINNRYAIISGCWPHNCMAKGFIWCDTHNKISVAALADTYTNELSLVTSRTVTYPQLPQRFYADLRDWLATIGVSASSTLFYDGRDTTWAMEVRL